MAKKATRKTKSAAASKKKRMKAKSPARAGAAPKGPTRVGTGRGAGPAEIGSDLVAMFNRGAMGEIEAKWHSPKIVSIEGVGVEMAWHGKKGVEAKSAEWMRTHVIHGASAEGPYIGASGFAVKFAMDVEDTEARTRVMMEEVGVYSVENGKIVREEFMYGKMTPVTPASQNGQA